MGNVNLNQIAGQGIIILILIISKWLRGIKYFRRGTYRFVLFATGKGDNYIPHS
jgi:hypothetical protein